MKSIFVAFTVAALATPSIAGAVNVVDGDTIEIDGQTIRIVQIDTPESYSPRCQAEATLAHKAETRLKELLTTGKVTFRATGHDRYGRTLAKVYAGKTDVGKAMIAEGHALAYKPGSEAKLARLQAWCGPTATLEYNPDSKPMQVAASKKQASQQDENVYYQNCSAARAAGAAPIMYGEPGYAPKLDRDRDGVACE